MLVSLVLMLITLHVNYTLGQEAIFTLPAPELLKARGVYVGSTLIEDEVYEGETSIISSKKVMKFLNINDDEDTMIIELSKSMLTATVELVKCYSNKFDYIDTNLDCINNVKCNHINCSATLISPHASVSRECLSLDPTCNITCTNSTTYVHSHEWFDDDIDCVYKLYKVDFLSPKTEISIIHKGRQETVTFSGLENHKRTKVTDFKLKRSSDNYNYDYIVTDDTHAYLIKDKYYIRDVIDNYLENTEIRPHNVDKMVKYTNITHNPLGNIITNIDINYKGSIVRRLLKTIHKVPYSIKKKEIRMNIEKMDHYLTFNNVYISSKTDIGKCEIKLRKNTLFRTLMIIPYNIEVNGSLKVLSTNCGLNTIFISCNEINYYEQENEIDECYIETIKGKPTTYQIKHTRREIRSVVINASSTKDGEKGRNNIQLIIALSIVFSLIGSITTYLIIRFVLSPHRVYNHVYQDLNINNVDIQSIPLPPIITKVDVSTMTDITLKDLIFNVSNKLDRPNNLVDNMGYEMPRVLTTATSSTTYENLKTDYVNMSNR